MQFLKKKLADNVLPFERPTHFSIECQDNLHYMRSLPDESMHLIVTSPPYNLGKSYERKTSNELYIEQQSAAIAEAFRRGVAAILVGGIVLEFPCCLTA